MSAEIQIGNLRIRVPGVSPHDARRLGERIAWRVSENLPHASQARELGDVRVRVAVPQGSSHDAIVTAVAKAIGEVLR